MKNCLADADCSTFVASEASVHRQKIAMMRSMFLSGEKYPYQPILSKFTLLSSPLVGKSYANICPGPLLFSKGLESPHNLRDHPCKTSTLQATTLEFYNRTEPLDSRSPVLHLDAGITSNSPSVHYKSMALPWNDSPDSIHNYKNRTHDRSPYTPSELLYGGTLTKLPSTRRHLSYRRFSSSIPTIGRYPSADNNCQIGLRHPSHDGRFKSANDIIQRQQYYNRSPSSISSSSSSCASLSYDEFWPLGPISKNLFGNPRGARSLNHLRQSEFRRHEWISSKEEMRAVNALVGRIQPMLVDGRVTDVRNILNEALRRRDTRERAISLLDLLAVADCGKMVSAILAVSTGDSVSDVSTTTSDMSNNSIRKIPSDVFATTRLRLADSGTVKVHEGASIVEEGTREEDDAAFSPILGGGGGGGHRTECGAPPHATSSVIRVMLPPPPSSLEREGLVEAPPPRLPMPPPPPSPGRLSRSAVMPATPKALAYLDLHALNMLDFNPLLITELVSQLTLGCTSDVEVVRRLFVWVTGKNFKSVEYDPTASEDSFIGLLRGVQMDSLTRNDLFYELCRFAGIYCRYISGFSKGAGYRPGMALNRRGNADDMVFRNTWMVVLAGGGWRFVNCNWAARYMDTAARPLWNSEANLQGSLSDVANLRCCDDFYFFTDPEQHIFEHLPDVREWQLLRTKPISQTRFISLPLLKSAFFNAGLSLQKPYSQNLITKNGKVVIKIRMPRFVGISCSLENCADGSSLRGLVLVEVLTGVPNTVRIHAAPSRPGRYYLNIYASPDWRREDIRELACSFQIHCREFNYSRLAVMGRLPEVGFLGQTPAARHFGISMTTSGIGSCRRRRRHSTRPYILHRSSEPLRLPFAVASRLRLCHQLKSFDRYGQPMCECDNFALLQMQQPHASSSSSSSSSSTSYSSFATKIADPAGVVSISSSSSPPSASAVGENARYHLRLPINGFYYLTVYAAYEELGRIQTGASDRLECVYRILVDARRPTCFSGVSGVAPPFPKQTYWWLGCRLLEPTRQSLECEKRHLFRLDVPTKYASVAVVINSSEWHFLKNSGCSSSAETTDPPIGTNRWSGVVVPTCTGGDLAIYVSSSNRSAQEGGDAFDSLEGVPFFRLLEYSLVSNNI